MTLRRALLAAFAAGLVLAAAFHAAAAVAPSLAPSSPTWRHALFVAINLAAAAGLLWRPRGFVPLFALLCLQQLASHGAEAWRARRDEARVDVTSIVVVCAMPVALALLVAETRARDSRRSGRSARE